MESAGSKRCASAVYVFLLTLLCNIQGVDALYVYSIWYFWFVIFALVFAFVFFFNCWRQKQRARAMRVGATSHTVVVHQQPPPHQHVHQQPPPHQPPPYMQQYPPPPGNPAYPPGYSAHMGMPNPAYPPGYSAHMGMPNPAPTDPFQKAAGGY